MAAPRRVKTGLEELEWLKKQREQGMGTMRIMRDTMRQAPVSALQVDAPAKLINDMQEAARKWEEEYYKPYKALHGTLGQYVGSSMDPEGSVSKSVSPNIPRDKVTGARIKPGTGLNPMGSEYLYEGRTGVAPKAEAYRLTNAYSAGASATSTAASTGKYISEIKSRMSATVRGGLSSYIETAHRLTDIPMAEAKNAILKKLTSDYGSMGMLNRDLRPSGGGNVIYNRPAVNQPVNPSVRVTPPAPLKPTGSALEPIKGTSTVPDIFKKAWGPGSFGSVALGPVFGQLGAAIKQGGEIAGGGSYSDWQATQTSTGKNLGTFTARNVLSSMRNPAYSPEQRYTIWKRFGPKRGY